MKNFLNKVKEIFKKVWKFIKNIYEKFVNLPQDELMHIIAISVITMVFTIVFKWLGHSLEACFIGFTIGFFFGLGKEACKLFKKFSIVVDFITASIIAIYSGILMI